MQQISAMQDEIDQYKLSNQVNVVVVVVVVVYLVEVVVVVVV